MFKKLYAHDLDVPSYLFGVLIATLGAFFTGKFVVKRKLESIEKDYEKKLYDNFSEGHKRGWDGAHLELKKYVDVDYYERIMGPYPQ